VIAAEASFYVTGGTLRHDAPSYVERQADHDVSAALLAGEFCYVLTPRQIGKSSLMVRTANKLREQGINIIALDLTAIGQNLTAEQWYDGLIVRMGRQLQLDDELDEFWGAHERLGPCQRLFAAIRDVVLRLRPGPLVIFVDEIDTVRSLPFSTDEFFAAIRECYNRRTEDPEFNRLTFCLLGVATPSDLIRDTRTTPFNIGRRIELHDFTWREAAPLAQGLWRLPGDGKVSTAASATSETAAGEVAQRLLKRILFWTGGHPYLTQRFCRTVADDPTVVDDARIDRVCEELFLSNQARERDDNLLFVRERLLRSDSDLASLLELYRRVRRGQTVLDDETSELVSVLRLSGIVKAQEGRLRERNHIYARAFDEKWVWAHMPDAEMRRQRAAFYRGVIRTTGIAAVVVTALTIAVLVGVNQAGKAEKALGQSYLSQAHAYFSQAQATRKSGISGQRHESLQALRAARSYYTNQAVLRDEVIACLALVDLKQTSGMHSPGSTGISEVNLDSEVSATAGADGTITLRGLASGQILQTLPGPGVRVAKLRFGPKQPLLVAEYHGGSDAQILVWNWQTARKLFSLAHEISGEAIDFSADGRKLAIGQTSGRVVVYSLPEGTVLNEFELRLTSGNPRVPQALRFSPSADCLAESSLDDWSVQIWRLESVHRRPSLLMSLYHPAEVYDVAWHQRGELLATACADSCVYLWNTNRTDRSKKLTGHEGRVTAVAFNHRGTLVASLGLDETIRLWIPATDRQVTGRWEGASLERLQFSANDHFLIASGKSPADPRVWEVLGGEYVALYVRGSPGDALRTIDFSPDSRTLATTSGHRAMIWDADSGHERGVLSFTNAHAAWFSAESQHLLASTDDGLFRGSLAAPGDGDRFRSGPETIQRLGQATNELGAMAITLDRSMAAIVHWDEVLLVPLEPLANSGTRTVPVNVHYHRVALHPTGRWLAAMVRGSDSLHVWDLSEGAENRSPAVVPSGEHFTFSPDGKWLVTCWAGEFQFYRVGAWPAPAFAIPRRPVSDQHAPIAFTKEGSIVALAISRYTIQLLRLSGKDGTERAVIATLEGPDRSPLEMLTFSADGRRLAAATKDQTIHLWNLKLLRDGLAELNLHDGWLAYP
jgi:WD40 repeat protein